MARPLPWVLLVLTLMVNAAIVSLFRVGPWPRPGAHRLGPPAGGAPVRALPAAAPAQPDTMPELRRRLAAFRASAALSECTGGFAARGDLRFTIRLDDGGLALTPAGSLAAAPAASCLEERLRAALDGLPWSPEDGAYQVALALVSPPP